MGILSLLYPVGTFKGREFARQEGAEMFENFLDRRMLHGRAPGHGEVLCRAKAKFFHLKHGFHKTVLDDMQVFSRWTSLDAVASDPGAPAARQQR